MRTSVTAALAATVLMLGAADAFAQQGRRGGAPRAAETASPVETQRNVRRGVPLYDQQGSGIVRWNTPNADGNFGTATGGGGGSP